jgi:hypothetical protein
MSAPKQTKLTELVETHNISLALQRVQKASTSFYPWRRALIHAIEMSGVCGDWEARKMIREALKLP